MRLRLMIPAGLALAAVLCLVIPGNAQAGPLRNLVAKCQERREARQTTGTQARQTPCETTSGPSFSFASPTIVTTAGSGSFAGGAATPCPCPLSSTRSPVPDAPSPATNSGVAGATMGQTGPAAATDPGATTTYPVECVMVDCTTADRRVEVMVRDYVPGGKRTVRIEPGVRLSLDWADATGMDPCQVYAWAFTEPILKKQARVTTDAAGRVTAVSVFHVLQDGRPWYAEPGTTPAGGQQPTPISVPVRRCPNTVIAGPVALPVGCSGATCRPAAPVVAPTGPTTDCPNGRCPLR